MLVHGFFLGGMLLPRFSKFCRLDIPPPQAFFFTAEVYLNLRKNKNWVNRCPNVFTKSGSLLDITYKYFGEKSIYSYNLKQYAPFPTYIAGVMGSPAP